MNDEPNNDIQILELLRSNREDDQNKGFILLYKKYFDMIYAMIRLNSGYKREAEDVFQDTMVVLFKNIRSGVFRGESRLSTYLYSIARFRWIKYLQKSKRMVLFEDLSGMEVTQPTAVWQEKPNLTHAITCLIEKLDSKCQEILKLYYFDKMSHSNIAEKLGLSNEGIAKQKKFRCIKKLMELLEKDPNLKTELEKCLN